MSDQFIGQYEILEEIGRGGMGVVYRAVDNSADREVALKVLPAQLVQEPEFLERFKREGRIIARLEHPHILPLYAVGDDKGRPYLAMRYMAGGSLQDRIEAGNVSLGLIVSLVAEIADALDVAHRQGIVHRDIKPGNVLFDQHGNVYLADFGIAKMLEGSVLFTAEGGFVGTPAYMAPEQWKGEPLDARADVYALTCMVYQSLTGELPYQASTTAAFMTKHLNDPVPSLRDRRPDLPPELDTLLREGMAKDPQNRPASASAFALRLSGATGHIDDGSRTLPAFERSTTRPQSSRIRMPLLLLAGIGILAVIVTGTIILRPIRDTPADDIADQSETESPESTEIPDQDTPPPATEAGITEPEPTPSPEITPYYSTASASVIQHTLSDHTASVRAIEWSPDGSKLASASNDGTLIIWDAQTEDPIVTLSGHNNRVATLTWSPDGSRIASGADDGQIIIWNADTGEQMNVITAHSSSVTSVDWSPDGLLLASGGRDNKIIIWSVNSGTQQILLSEHTGPIVGVAWDSSGGRLVSGSDDGRAIFWNTTHWTIEATHTGTGSPITALNWIHSFYWDNILIGDGDNTFYMYRFNDNDSLESVVTIEGWQAPIIALDINDVPVSAYVALADESESIWLYEPIAPDNFRLIAWFVNWNGIDFTSLDFSPNLDTLAAGLEDGRIILYDVSVFNP